MNIKRAMLDTFTIDRYPKRVIRCEIINYDTFDTNFFRSLVQNALDASLWNQTKLLIDKPILLFFESFESFTKGGGVELEVELNCEKNFQQEIPINL